MHELFVLAGIVLAFGVFLAIVMKMNQQGDYNSFLMYDTIYFMKYVDRQRGIEHPTTEVDESIKKRGDEYRKRGWISGWEKRFNELPRRSKAKRHKK